MPVPGNGARAGSVPLDALDAEEIADLLGCAAAVTGALAGDPAAEGACAGLAGDWQDLDGLHAALAIAAADLDDAVDPAPGHHADREAVPRPLHPARHLLFTAPDGLHPAGARPPGDRA